MTIFLIFRLNFYFFFIFFNLMTFLEKRPHQPILKVWSCLFILADNWFPLFTYIF